MRKLGIWGGPILATMLVVGVAGLTAGPARAQDRAVPWLGVMTQSLDEGLREGLDYEGEGVLVSQVVSNSPASRAGIRKGDILVSVNSRGFDSPSELTRVIRAARVGQTVSIMLMRDGQRRTVNARLGDRPEGADAPDMDMGELRDLPHKMGDDDSHKMGDDDSHKMGDDFMKEWRSQGGPGSVFRSMGRGRLGIRIEDLKGDLGSYFDVPEDKGALIVEVLDDTPAEKAGLKAGDVITEVGGHRISDSQDLVEALRDQPKGRVSITVLRKGSRRSVQADLDDAQRSMRIGPGRDLTIVRPRGDSQDRMGRHEVRRNTDSEDSEELRQLREEVRQLRQKLDQLENENGDDDHDGDDGDDR